MARFGLTFAFCVGVSGVCAVTFICVALEYIERDLLVKPASERDNVLMAPVFGRGELRRRPLNIYLHLGNGDTLRLQILN